MRDRQLRQTLKYREDLKNKRKEQKERWAIQETEWMSAEKKRNSVGFGEERAVWPERRS